MSLVEKALSKMKQAEAAKAVERPPPAQPAAPSPVLAAAEPARVEALAPRVDAGARAPVDHPQLKIDADSLRAAGYLPPPQQERELVEQYRHIKRPLVARALGRAGATPGRHMNVLMITSALPQEGKTFTALNLTRSFALEKDATVLLVDCDVANPQTTRVLQGQDRPGLIDALSDASLDVESLVNETNVPGVQVLTLGRATDLGAELLGSQRMSDVVERLLQAAPKRVILLDSAPLLVTNEGKALIPLAGQVVLVVQANSTPQHAVLEAADLFAEDQYVGVVLNQCEEAVGLGYGYYGGTYNYGGSYGYGSHGRKDSDRGSGG
jgi:exopolysaccharide/PEP-CTERM locus tyrosine autokinase